MPHPTEGTHTSLPVPLSAAAAAVVMARRKSKKPQQDDTSILLDQPVPLSKRRINSYTSSALVFIVIFTVGVSIMGWFCAQQQQSLDQLTASFTTMERKITRLQQVMHMTDEQVTSQLTFLTHVFCWAGQLIAKYLLSLLSFVLLCNKVKFNRQLSFLNLIWSIRGDSSHIMIH